MFNCPSIVIAVFYFATYPTNYSYPRYSQPMTLWQACEFEENKTQSNIIVYRVRLKSRSCLVGDDVVPEIDKPTLDCPKPSVAEKTKDNQK